MANSTPITVAHGDGIGPEIMSATPQIIEAACARIQQEVGIEASSWELLGRTRVRLLCRMAFARAERCCGDAGMANAGGLELAMIDNRDVKVWPGGMAKIVCTDCFRCRFESKNGTTQKQTVALTGRVLDQGLEIVKTGSLRSYQGQLGFSLAQGQ